MRDRIAYGFAAMAAGHLTQLLLYLVVSSLERPGSGPIPSSFFILLGFGVFQFAYVIPFTGFAIFTSRTRTAVTIVVLAILTLAANAVFWLVLGASGNLVP